MSRRSGRSRRRKRFFPIASVGLLVAAGCGASQSSGNGPTFALSAAAASPATEPYLVMSGPSAGWAVWPSGGSWLLLATADGFQHVTNGTPLAVETSGGLTLTVAGSRVAVAVGAHERLLRSPVLVGAVGAAGSSWRPLELPGATSGARGAVSLASGGLTAVTATGAILRSSGTRWSTLTDAAKLSPDGRLHVDAITWASPRLGWATGHGPAGHALAFQTSDAGQSWRPVDGTSGTAIAALPACGAGSSWLLPVIDSTGQERLLRTADSGRTWSRGRPLVTPRLPAWACSGRQVWMAGLVGGSEHVFASADAGDTWSDRGRAPSGLSDLTLTGAGRGLAASAGSGGRHPALWSVSADGARFTALPLPHWVAAVGDQTGGGS